MITHKEELEEIANSLLDQMGQKPNYTNRDFMNAVIIFQTALMDKLYDNQDYDKMDLENREKMAVKCGEDLRKLIHTYTNLDTHKLEDFLK
jgi:hypothetical protein